MNIEIPKVNIECPKCGRVALLDCITLDLTGTGNIKTYGESKIEYRCTCEGFTAKIDIRGKVNRN